MARESTPSCAGCAARDETIAWLQEKVLELLQIVASQLIRNAYSHNRRAVKFLIMTEKHRFLTCLYFAIASAEFDLPHWRCRRR